MVPVPDRGHVFRMGSIADLVPAFETVVPLLANRSAAQKRVEHHAAGRNIPPRQSVSMSFSG